MKRLLFISIALVSLSSCQVVLKKMYGIHKPRVEDRRSITKKALHYKLDTSNIVTVNSSDFMKVLVSQGIPDGAVFDSKGEYIEWRPTDTTTCNAGLFGFLPTLLKEGSYNRTGKMKLSDELPKFRDLGGNKIAFNDLSQYDYVVLLYWSTWTGKLNKDHVQPWEQLARENKNVRIKVIKVNLDMQEYWDKEEKKKIRNQLRHAHQKA